MAPAACGIAYTSAEIFGPGRSKVFDGVDSALTRGGRWLAADPSPAGRVIAARLSALIRHAARLRQEIRLSELERGLRFVAGGHTAGEELLLDRLVKTADRQLVTGLRGTVPHPEWSGIEARLTGLIVFGP